MGPSPRTTEGNTTEWKQVTRGGGGEREERREKEGARQGDRELKEAPYKTWDTKSGLHARGEGERVLALESREGTREACQLS